MDYYIKYITDILRLFDDTSRGIQFFYHIDRLLVKVGECTSKDQ